MPTIFDTSHIEDAVDFRIKVTEKEPKTRLYGSIINLANELLNINVEVREF